MALDIIIDIDPEDIRTIEELEQVISKIEIYMKKTKTEAGVVLKQNLQLGASYRIVSKIKAYEGMKKERIGEWYVKYWPHSYFESLREKLKRE